MPSQYDALMAALDERRKQAAMSQDALLQAQIQQDAYNTRRSRGIIPMIGETIFDNIRKKQTAPAYRETLAKALDSASGVDEIARQLEAMQAQAQAQQEQELYTRERRDKALDMATEFGYDRQLQELKNQRGPVNKIDVNTGTPAGDPYAPKRNELAIEENQAIYQRGEGARQSLPSYETALKLLEEVETGPLSSRINAAKKYAGSLGADVDWDAIASYEQLSPIFGKLTMEKIQDTKGSVSNKEMEMFERMNANYNYSTEGNRRLLMYARDRAKRDIQIRNLIRDMRQEGKTPMEISDAVDKYVESNDLSGIFAGQVETGQQSQEGQVFMNDAGEKIRWDGKQWVRVN